VTTASGPDVFAVLGHHGLARLFGIAVTGREVASRKVTAEDCLIVEDQYIGVQNAPRLAPGASE
jgi:beta-phosphoglucomutase-like phosphatase (HAD superfamily)